MESFKEKVMRRKRYFFLFLSTLSSEMRGMSHIFYLPCRISMQLVYLRGKCMYVNMHLKREMLSREQKSTVEYPGRKCTQQSTKERRQPGNKFTTGRHISRPIFPACLFASCKERISSTIFLPNNILSCNNFVHNKINIVLGKVSKK